MSKSYYLKNKEKINQESKLKYASMTPEERNARLSKNKQYYEKNKLLFKERAHKQYIQRREEIKLRTKQYYKENKEVVLQKQKGYYMDNQIKKILTSREYYYKNFDKIKAHASNLWVENPDKIRAWKKKYREANIHKEKARNQAKYRIQIPKGKICERCGINPATDRHHEDYSKPLEVLFVCHRCNNNMERICLKEVSP